MKHTITRFHKIAVTYIILTGALSLVHCIVAIAQNNPQHFKIEADKHYQNEQYALAIPYYQELALLADQRADVNYQLAECYRKVFDYPNAEAYYLKVFYEAQREFPLSLYYYSLMLKLNGSFEESINYFTAFIYANAHDNELTAFVEQAIVDRAGSEMAKLELAKNNVYYPFNSLNINTDFNDYAPALLDSNTLVITSGRVESNRAAIDQRYGEAFTNNFYFIKQGKEWQDKTKQFFKIMNTRYNDGPGSFAGKGDKYYFTVCGKDGPQCRIFVATLNSNKWSEPKALNDNINFKNFESKHPGVSKGGDTLLFSSDRIGGFGKFDIWMSINSGDDHWGPAINLGSTVNTKLNELAPAFSTFSHIFFIASDGHQSYGGLDVYMVKRFSTGVLALYNLDFPFNSAHDDCFISFSERQAYISSNRKGGFGGFDIYSVEIPSVISFVSRLSLKNRDARGDIKITPKTERINNLDLLIVRNEDRIEYENLTYEKKKIVDQMVLNRMNNKSNLLSNFKGLTETEYQLFTRISETFYKNSEVQKQFSNTFLAQIKSQASANQGTSVTGVLRDSLTGKVLSGRKIILKDTLGELLKITYTNELGQFRFMNLIANQEGQLHLGNIPLETSEKVIIEDLTIRASENYTTYKFENIYFDFNLYQLRPEAIQVLNDLVAFLRTSPSVQVEIYAYADEKGTAEYNFILTQKRGQAVLNYLASKGIDETSLAVIAKGRQEDTKTNLDTQRQYNRRVEFYLNGAQQSSPQTVKTYILKMNSTWALLATSTGVTVDVLKKLNGSVSDEVQIFQPIRLPISDKAVSENLFFAVH